MTPSTPSRRVLLCATGMSPQIVTETLYALAVRPAAGQEVWTPTEVHLISTRKGAEHARLNLLSDQPGWFHQLCKDYDLPHMQFSNEQIHHILGENGQELEDIRSPADNEAAANTIADLVRAFAQDDDAQLHVSIAGGRKTMGYYLGYALSLYGRPQDRLSHVLVNDPYESHPDFYYPTPYERVIHTRDPKLPEAKDCRNAVVELAQIPFVRLRDGLPQRLLEGRGSFTQTVEAANLAQEPAQVVVKLQSRQVEVNGIPIAFNGAAYAVYVWLARRALDDKPAVDWKSFEEARDFLDAVPVLLPSFSADAERIEETLRPYLRGQDEAGLEGYFRPLISRSLNGALKVALGPALAARAWVVNSGARTKSRYQLPADLQIELRDA